MSKVIVAGSIITDMSVKVSTHPQVGETVMGDNLSYSPGGKGANQAVAAARLGADVTMIGVVGEDQHGMNSCDFLDQQGISCVIKDGFGPTGIAMIVVNEKGNNNIVVVPGANMELTPNDVDSGKIVYRKHDVLVAQFEIPLETVKRFFHNGKHSNCINVLNPAPAIMNDKVLEILNLTDVLIVNETELGVFAGLTLEEYQKKYGPYLNHKDTGCNHLISLILKKLQTPPSVVIVTLGDKGVHTYIGSSSAGVSFETSSIEVRAVDTTGAGDCFVGAFAKKLSEGGKSLLDPILIMDGKLQDCVSYANYAAACSVTKEGSGLSMPTIDELDLFMVEP